MKTRHWAPFVMTCVVCALAAPRLGAQEPFPLPPPMAAQQGVPGSVVELDRNGDGRIDYRVIYDANGKVSQEQLDFKGTGRMDTFYYYKDGVLDRVEIDSTGTGKIDIWVYLIDGKYVQRYERDTDGDGKPDVVRKFGG